MSTLFHSLIPNLAPSPLTNRTVTRCLVLPRTNFATIQRPFSSRGSFVVTRFGLGQVPIPDPGDAEMMVREFVERAEGFLYTLADAAVSASDTVDAAGVANKNSDWLSGITNGMETVLKVLKGGLSTLHVPYSYGFAIILLTVLVKAATFPLSKKQVESAMAMQTLTPQIKAIQERYAGDQERIQLETARLYKLAGINPLAGCLPTLATIPIWIGLYRALSNVADEGLLTEGFFWIPSLSGPTTVAARQMGSGTSWLFPFMDGHPPLGWSDTLAYLVLPVLLVVSQYISVQIMQPPQSDDPNVKNSQAITKFLPLMIGYFALSVPSGLSLYWFTNNLLSTAQTVWLRKLGGAKSPLPQLSEDSIKKDKSPISKATIEAPAITKKAIVKEDKPVLDGPSPGSRFKQLKEQEARKKKQREEEARKSFEAVSKGIEEISTEIKKENGSLGREDGGDETSSSSNSIVNGDSSSQDGFSVNGNGHSEPKSIHKGERPEALVDQSDEKSVDGLIKNIEKD